MNLLKRKQKNLDAAEVAEEGGELAVNDAAAKRQKLALYGGGGVLAAVAMAWILAPSTEPNEGKLTQGDDKSEVKVATDDLVNRNMSEAEWMARSEGQMISFNNQIKGLEGQSKQIEGLEAQIQALQSEKSAMADDGTRVLGAYEQENQQLKAALAEAKRAPVAGPTGLYGRGAPGTYQPAGVAPGSALAKAAVDAPAARTNEIKLVSFDGGSGGTGNRITPSKATSYTDSPNYLPPNSIAHAVVVVGVDAAANVKSQSDPLPVVLRITGPARSVYSQGKLLRTTIEGCMVNGAAQGDLSSEKVYVKLQRMTCPQPGGRFAVSEVKGFVAFGGKTGVRGNVVSREGSLAMQAFMAGLVGGAGNALDSAFQQPLATIDTDGDGGANRTPSLGNVGLRALGGGAQETGKNVSEYLIERAEQYQPVIEMPTGIEVEVVFLEGVFIRN